MRNIAEIIKDDRKGKQLSGTERQIAVAYFQGKYDAVMELKISKNSDNSNTNEVLDKIRAEILSHPYEGFELGGFKDGYTAATVRVLDIIDKYKKESEE